MDFIEIIVEINVLDLEVASAISNTVVPYGIYIEDYSNLETETEEITHSSLIDESLLSKNRDLAWIHIYVPEEENATESIAFLQERLTVSRIEHKISIKVCKVDEYINNWKQYFNPICVGNRLVISPSWKKPDAQYSGRKILKIDPGLAFGTGSHETTQLCLEMLEKYLKPKNNLLDIGCGSGILSIAAILLGANKATGVDIDELAIKTAKENAKINKISDKFIAICGDLIEKINGKFDIILANLVSDVIIRLNKTVKNYMHENSIYIMSGIIEIYRNDVMKSLESNFEVVDIKNKNGWLAIAVKLKNK